MHLDVGLWSSSIVIECLLNAMATVQRIFASVGLKPLHMFFFTIAVSVGLLTPMLRAGAASDLAEKLSDQRKKGQKALPAGKADRKRSRKR